MNLKKIFSAANILTVLIILSVLFIGYFSVKDYFMTPENKLSAAMEMMRQNKPYKAERYFLMATKTDNRDVARLAAYHVGNLYLNGMAGFNKNPQKAVEFLEKSAWLGSTRAAYELALLYDVGDKIPENRDKAIIHMVQAAEDGMPEALYAMGVWAERGYMGDIPMSSIVTVYQMAAKKGHQNAIKSLIAIYKGGYGNFPYNIQQANFWLAQLNQEKQQMKEESK